MDQRRGDALVQVCRRATAATAMVTRAGANATVIVTIGLDDLRHRCRPGVLAGTGQILDLGSARRAFTSAPAPRAVATRPALHRPRLHHPRHLGRRPPHPALGRRREHRPGQSFAVYEGDASSMCAACCRLTALVAPAGVRWNRRLGSYDDALARGPTATPAA